MKKILCYIMCGSILLNGCVKNNNKQNQALISTTQKIYYKDITKEEKTCTSIDQILTKINNNGIAIGNTAKSTTGNIEDCLPISVLFANNKISNLNNLDITSGISDNNIVVGQNIISIDPLTPSLSLAYLPLSTHKLVTIEEIRAPRLGAYISGNGQYITGSNIGNTDLNNNTIPDGQRIIKVNSDFNYSFIPLTLSTSIIGEHQFIYGVSFGVSSAGSTYGIVMGDAEPFICQAEHNPDTDTCNTFTSNVSAAAISDNGIHIYAYGFPYKQNDAVFYTIEPNPSNKMSPINDLSDFQPPTFKCDGDDCDSDSNRKPVLFKTFDNGTLILYGHKAQESDDYYLYIPKNNSHNFSLKKMSIALEHIQLPDLDLNKFDLVSVSNNGMNLIFRNKLLANYSFTPKPEDILFITININKPLWDL